MKCPHDNADLVMADRQGIEIDYCPTCRGVWLDRGELDKIIERSAATAPAQAAAPASPRNEPQQARAVDPRREYDRGYGERGEHGEGGEYGERGEHGERGYGYGSGRRRRRESFLGELFDF